MRAGRRRFGHRLPLMAASLLLAVLFWFVVNVREKVEVGFMVPLLFEGLPAGVMIDGTPLGTVSVRLRGSRQAVEKILPQQLQARVSLAGAKPGRNFVHIPPQAIPLPPGTTLVGISPPYLDLAFLARAAVPVKVRTEGSPAPGYELKAAYAVPAEVEIVGSPEQIAAVRSLETHPVDLDDRREGLRQRAEFVLGGTKVRLLEIKPTEIVVQIGLREAVRAYAGIPVLGAERGWRADPDRVGVTVRGPAAKLAELSPEKIQVHVDAAARTPEGLRPLQVTLPPGLAAVLVDPPAVQLRERGGARPASK